MVNGIRTSPHPVDSIKDLVRSSVKVLEFDEHLKKAGGHIGRNVVEITIKMKTVVRKPLMIKISNFSFKYLYQIKNIKEQIRQPFFFANIFLQSGKIYEIVVKATLISLMNT